MYIDYGRNGIGFSGRSGPDAETNDQWNSLTGGGVQGYGFNVKDSKVNPQSTTSRQPSKPLPTASPEYAQCRSILAATAAARRTAEFSADNLVLVVLTETDLVVYKRKSSSYG
jgi:hypothetical protein